MEKSSRGMKMYPSKPNWDHTGQLWGQERPSCYANFRPLISDFVLSSFISCNPQKFPVFN